MGFFFFFFQRHHFVKPFEFLYRKQRFYKEDTMPLSLVGFTAQQLASE